ncbi:MAG: hypothetical protein Q8P63_02815 [Candidatus Nealsonbacteria bacterium]|nr:hypothetical protein [Candidatus Nealsonbacteria bacterium]
MEAQEEIRKFWTGVDRYLRANIELEIPNRSTTENEIMFGFPKLPGVVDVRPQGQRDSTIISLQPKENGKANTASITIPAKIFSRVCWAQILFAKRLRKNDSARVRFARKGEKETFYFGQKNHLPLRIWRPGPPAHLFNPVYVRIDHKEDPTYYFLLSAHWVGREISINVSREINPNMIPDFLKK